VTDPPAPTTQCGRPPPEQNLPPAFPRTSKPFACDRNSAAAQKRKKEKEREKQRQIAQEARRVADRERRAATTRERQAAAAEKAARAAQQLEYEASLPPLDMEGRAERKRKKPWGGKGPMGCLTLPAGRDPSVQEEEDAYAEEALLPRSRVARRGGSEGVDPDGRGLDSPTAGQAPGGSPGGRHVRAKRERAIGTQNGGAGGDAGRGVYESGGSSKRKDPPCCHADNIYIGFEDLPNPASMAMEVRARAAASGIVTVSDESVGYIRHAMQIYINRILDTCQHSSHGFDQGGAPTAKVLTMEDVRNATVDLQHKLPPWNLGKLREMCFVNCEIEPRTHPPWGEEEEVEEEEESEC